MTYNSNVVMRGHLRVVTVVIAADRFIFRAEGDMTIKYFYDCIAQLKRGVALIERRYKRKRRHANKNMKTNVFPCAASSRSTDLKERYAYFKVLLNFC